VNTERRRWRLTSITAANSWSVVSLAAFDRVAPALFTQPVERAVSATPRSSLHGAGGCDVQLADLGRSYPLSRNAPLVRLSKWGSRPQDHVSSGAGHGHRRRRPIPRLPLLPRSYGRQEKAGSRSRRMRFAGVSR